MQELLVLYRSKPSGVEWVSALRQRFMGPQDHEKSPRFRRRNQIYMRVFRDVPLPTWKIVFPEKLLQFRPLDSARADILSLSGSPSWPWKTIGVFLAVKSTNSPLGGEGNIVDSHLYNEDQCQETTNLAQELHPGAHLQNRLLWQRQCCLIFDA